MGFFVGCLVDLLVVGFRVGFLVPSAFLVGFLVVFFVVGSSVVFAELGLVVVVVVVPAF